MKFKRSTAEIILVTGGFLMFVDTLLAWQSVDVGRLTYTRNAWHGFWGIILGLLSIGFLVNAATQAGVVELKIRLPHRSMSVLLAVAILVFAVVKAIRDDNSGWASYVGIVLAVAITLAALNAWKEKREPKAAPAPPRSFRRRSRRPRTRRPSCSPRRSCGRARSSARPSCRRSSRSPCPRACRSPSPLHATRSSAA